MTSNTPTSPPEGERGAPGATAPDTGGTSTGATPRAATNGPATTVTSRGTAPFADQQPAGPDRVRGPHVAAVLLGLVCLVVAGLVLGQELGDLSIDWGGVGPLGIVAAGAVLVVLGAIGLAASRRDRA